MTMFNEKTGTGGGVAAVLLLVPSVAFAAGDESEIVKTTIYHLINLVALLAVAIHFGRKPVSRFLKERKAKVTAELEAARKLHEEARALVAQYESQIKGLDAEKAAILTEYREIGEAERDKIIAAARRQSEKLAKDAERTVESEIARAKSALEAEVVRLASEMAEKAICEKLDAGRQSKLIDDYINNLEGVLQA